MSSFHLIQQRNKWSCLACCAAMITHTTVHDVIEFVGYDGSEVIEDEAHLPTEGRKAFEWYDIARYLMAHQIGLGCGLGWEQPQKLAPGKIEYTVDLSRQAALLLVESADSPDLTHAVLWDGERIYDPNPATNYKTLDRYRVHSVWILFYYED